MALLLVEMLGNSPENMVSVGINPAELLIHGCDFILKIDILVLSGASVPELILKRRNLTGGVCVGFFQTLDVFDGCKRVSQCSELGVGGNGTRKPTFAQNLPFA